MIFRFDFMTARAPAASTYHNRRESHRSGCGRWVLSSGTARGAAGGLGLSEKVPAITGDVDEDCDSPIRLIARRPDELHAGVTHSREGGVEIIDPQEQADTAGELLPNRRSLMSCVRAREQHARGPTGEIGRAHL